ncbi:hypothetical protein INT45_005137 [Circinella minor]|uniref:Uncharacterized protein n=1 Tax=Circinella minor TaxID=1195481 RepID=A0A8H7RCR9_9FUNG|nr:hypothetical protein INT45_005137 [Circinella minor]
MAQIRGTMNKKKGKDKGKQVMSFVDEDGPEDSITDMVIDSLEESKSSTSTVNGEELNLLVADWSRELVEEDLYEDPNLGFRNDDQTHPIENKKYKWKLEDLLS